MGWGFLFCAIYRLGVTNLFFGYTFTASYFLFGGFNVSSFYNFGFSGFGRRSLCGDSLREEGTRNSIRGSGTSRGSCQSRGRRFYR
jgi:hypothetical protein